MALFLKTGADKLFDVLTSDETDPTGNGTGKYSFELSGTNFTVSNETAWGVNKDAFVKVDDASDRSVTVDNFVYANIDTSAAAHSQINVFGAKRGDIVTGSGDDIVNVFVLNSLDAGVGDYSNPDNPKNSLFNIDTGGGNDTISFDAGTVSPGRNTNLSQYTVTLIHAGAGNDTVDMRNDTVDTIFGDDGNDTINAGGGNDTVDGGDGNDTLNGGNGNDTITDLAGTTTAIDGGDGNDNVILGVASGTVNGGAGIDSLRLALTDLTALAISNFEVLETQGNNISATNAQLESFDKITVLDDGAHESSMIDLTISDETALDLTDELGSRSVHIHIAGLGGNVTTGAGNDILDAGAEGTTLNGGAGDDTINGGQGNDVLIGGDGNDAIFDNGELGTTIDGGAGDDKIFVSITNGGTVDGGAGTDSFSYSGRDLLGLTFTNVEVLETLGNTATARAEQFESFDKIVTFNDGAHETEPVALVISGGSAVDLSDELESRAADITLEDNASGVTSGAGDDTLHGWLGGETLNGGAGSDTLYGSTGNDVLTGGTGNDHFVFDTTPNTTTNRDDITDFEVGSDEIWLDNAIFAALTAADAAGHLTASQFHIGASATSASDRVIYDQALGKLFYDADGAGGGAQVQFASITTGLAMTADDFIVV